MNIIDNMCDQMNDADPLGRLLHLRHAIPGRLVFTSSLGLEDQALTHLIFANNLDIEVVTLDTGRLFEETRALWAATEARYGHHIRAIHPSASDVEELIARDGVNGFYQSLEARQSCCHVRKIAPLRRALAGASAWITGLRADQSADRANTKLVEHDAAFGIVKVNPLLDWSRPRIEAFIAAHDIPVNRLHGEGYLSIGCAPCTRAINPGEDERAGRWWWENDKGTAKECGLHVDAHGRLSRAGAPERRP